MLLSADPTFDVARSYPIGDWPGEVVAADLNGDGKIDLATANEHSGSVLLNNGDGTFAPGNDFGAGFESYGMTAADFNGDGMVDLATANHFDSTVTVLLNNGDGTFETDVHYATEPFPTGVTAADFNGDGKMDLATANYGINTVSVLLNNGDGTFATGVAYATGISPNSLTAADFDGDGTVDLATANQNSISVLLNNGDGTFAPQVAYDNDSGSYGRSVTAVDFNGDGKADLAMANYSANANAVTVLLNNGDGTFAPMVDYAIGAAPFSLTAADFNGDGNTDLATANFTAGSVSVLKNNGDGTFATHVDHIIPNSVTDSVAAADFNGDGKMDLATTTSLVDANSVMVLLNTTAAQPGPASPGLSASPGQTVTLLAPAFSWITAGAASEYGLYISQLQPNGTYKLIFDSTDPARQITIPGDASSYTLPAGILQDGGQYRWNMNAKINGAWGPYSGRLYFKVSTAPVPATPTGLSATPLDASTIRLQWNAVAGAGVSYKLYRATSTTGPWTTPIYYSSAATTTDYGPLLPATTYYYRVAANNFTGDSALSAVLTVNTAVGIVPPVPTNLTATVTGSNEVTLNWDDVLGQAGATPGGPLGAPSLGSYVVEQSDGGPLGFKVIAVVPAGQHTLLDTSFSNSTPQTTLHYRVKSEIGISVSPYSDERLIELLLATGTVDPLIVGTIPTLAAADRSHVSKVYRWNWNIEPTEDNRAQMWLPVTDLSTGIDWSQNKTIILTHGWNDEFDNNPAKIEDFDQEYMTIFARDYSAGRNLSAADRPNILAVDWHGSTVEHTISLGSDPDGNPDSAIGGYLSGDATNSSLNAILDGYMLADQIESANPGRIRPGSLMLVGHSNGAGFMAAMASEFYRLTGQRTSDLVALDAPWAPTVYAYRAVEGAAPFVNRIQNYYIPLVQTSVEGGVPDAPVGIAISEGAGAAMHGAANIQNFELNTTIPAYGLFNRLPLTNLIAHNRVPIRWAHTAGPWMAVAHPWGYQVSPYELGTFQFGTSLSSTFSETETGVFVVRSFLDRLSNAAVGVFNTLDGDVFTSSTPVFEPTSTPAFTGQNSKILSPTQPMTPTFSPTPWIVSNGYNFPPLRGAPVGAPSMHGPVLASIAVTVPQNARFLTFDLTATDASDADTLLVGMGNDLIGEISLARFAAGGGGNIELAVSQFAGLQGTLNFYLPAETTSTAEFIIGNMAFAIITPDNTPPTVTSSRFDFDGKPQSLAIVFSEAVGSATEFALTLTNSSTGAAIDSANLAYSFDTETNTARWTFPGYANGILPDGNYAVALASDLVLDGGGNPLDGDNNGTAGGDFATTFYSLAGDANRDRSVGFADLVAVAQSYGASGKTWATGDFNGDGNVDFQDLVVVAQNYGKSLPAPASPVAAATAALARGLAAKPAAIPAKWTKPAPAQPIPPAPPASIHPLDSKPFSGIFATTPVKRRRMTEEVLN